MRCGYSDDWKFWASIEAARWAGRHVRAIDGDGKVMMYSPLWPGKAQREEPQKKRPRSKASIKKNTRQVEIHQL